MPAIANPPAIKVPSLKELTAAPIAAPPAAEPKPGEGAPAPGPGENGNPENKQVEIDTQIVQRPTGAPVTTAKGAAEFKQERLQGKQQKQDFASLQSEFDQTKIQFTQQGLELEKLRKDLADRDKAIEDNKKLAESRGKDLEDLRTGYYEQHRATWNPLEDAEFQTASQTMIERLRQKLPMRVPAGEDAQGQKKEARVFFDTILQQNGAHQGLANILDAYAIAKRHANEPGLTRAINAAAQFLGAAVDMTDPDETKWKTLPANDPTFKAIEEALDEATPFHLQRAERYAQVQKEGPALAKQQFEQRQNGIRQTLAGDIFLSPDVANKRLQADPDDTGALMAVIMSQSPQLKEIAERKLNDFAQAYAAMGDRLFLPGLSSANASEIAAHRQKEATTRGMLSEAMRLAVIGATVGPVISSLMHERDSAEERATAASLLTNPGGEGAAKAGKDGRPPVPHIATEIVTGQ